jgi:hypothetical protein
MANWLSLPNKFYIELNLLIDCDISTNSLIVCYSNTDWTYSHYRSIAISILNEYTIIYWLVIYHYIPCRPGIQNSVIVHDFNTNGDIQTVTSLLSEYTNLLTAHANITDRLLPDIYNHYWSITASILTDYYTITDQRHTNWLYSLLLQYWPSIQLCVTSILSGYTNL